MRLIVILEAAKTGSGANVHLPLLIFIVSLIAGLICLGGFLWSAMEQKPKAIWLIGLGVAIMVGFAGLVVHYGS